jgi:hypothetical protein
LVRRLDTLEASADERAQAGILAAGVLAARLGTYSDGANNVPHASHIALEQVRLRAHFDSVLVELRARDVADLTVNQRAARSELTTWLAEYRDAERFPLNDRYSDSLTDSHSRGGLRDGVPIERSGRTDIVDRVASTRNLTHVRELTNDSALVAWLDSVGFDVQEAARVQPTYGTPESRRNVSREYAVASMVVSGASLATATWNLVEPNRAVGLLGVITGGFTMIAGLIPLNVDATSTDGDRAVGSINVVTGGGAVIAGIYALIKRRSPSPTSSPSPERRAASWGIALDPIRSASGERSVRVGLVGRF